jgi:hypothetical protein
MAAPGVRDLPEQRGLVSYARSAIGSAANLPDYRVNVVDMAVHSPTHALMLPAEITATEVARAQEDNREELLRQPVGRTLRIDPQVDGPQRRVIVLHNPDRNPDTGEPYPIPDPVLVGIAGRTQPEKMLVVPVIKSVPFLMDCVDEFLATGSVTSSEKMGNSREMGQAALLRETAEERDARVAAAEEETRAERRAAVLERLEEERQAGSKWHLARRSAGVKKPIMTWFTAEERDLLRQLYNDGSDLEVCRTFALRAYF